MTKYENVKGCMFVVSSWLLTTTYYNLWPDSPSALVVLAFFCYAPFFAWLFLNVAKAKSKQIVLSSLYFVTVGTLICYHFGIDISYGAGVGLVQSLVILGVVSLWKCNNTIADTWFLCLVLITWVTMDYLVSLNYGIAFLPPIHVYRVPFLIQPVSLFGFAFMDAFVIGVNLWIGTLLTSVFEGRKQVVQHPTRILIGGLILLSAWIFLCFMLYQDGENISDTVRVSTISPGRAFVGDLSDIVQLTENASIDQKSQLIVWPELYINPRRSGPKTCEQYIRDTILPALKHVDSYVIVGCDERTDDTECPYGNLAFTVAPRGSSILGHYGKQHPVTMIGEKSCIRNGYHSYTIEEGREVNKQSVPPGLTFSTLICFDMDFADSTALVADQGAHVILNPSEDWTRARGHFAASVFRAVENRVAVAKCDWGWDSVIVDPYGNIQASFASTQEHRQILTSDVSVISTRTGWNYYRQNVFPWMCMLCLTVFVFSKLAHLMNVPTESDRADIEQRLVIAVD